ncbi:MAG: M23 family metallopeptidase [bacterium]|nr:M23 family metallopeptidase [bacterium]
MAKTILQVVVLFILGGFFLFFWQWRSGNVASRPTNEIQNTVNEPPNPASDLSLPLVDALSRVNKKPFGIYITPKNSPVSPEKFTGYHTGADFEIFPGEENKDISVFAICKGKLLVKEFGRGYGGMLVQACDINNQSATVVYGHLKLESVTFKIDDDITAGAIIGILGKGYTNETDYERKHLHMGIHKGSAINTRGYIATEAELINWIDPLLILK